MGRQRNIGDPRLTTLPNVRDADVAGKRVLLRAELNVPFQPGTRTISDNSRIGATLPTLELLRERGAKTIICTHVGRPNGSWNDDLTVEPVRQRISELLGTEVQYGGMVGSDECRAAVDDCQPGSVVFLENLRFQPGEEANDPHFAEQLAALGDVYVNDAFGAAHRTHASIVGVPHIVRTRFAGLLLAAEDKALRRAMEPTDGVSIAVVGGAKAEDKLALIRNLAPRFDHVLIGGGMVRGFGYARLALGSLDNPEVAMATELMSSAEVARKIVLPPDVKATRDFGPSASFNEVDIETASNEGRLILDIGNRAVSTYTNMLNQASKIVWNGPMGVFEWERFNQGTKAVAKAIANRGDSAFTVAGGGSTAEALGMFGLADKLDHVSTGGGATLEYLEGKTLPGIAALQSD